MLLLLLLLLLVLSSTLLHLFEPVFQLNLESCKPRLNRIELRDLGNKGLIPGLTKSSW